MLLVPGLVYRMSSWSRAILVPLAVVHSSDPCRPVPAGFNVQELMRPDGGFAIAHPRGGPSWRNLFLELDRVAKTWERWGSRAVRKRAMCAAERWIVEHLQDSDGLGAIYPPMMYAIMALENEPLSRSVSYDPSGTETTVQVRRLHLVRPEEGGAGDCSHCPARAFDCAKADWGDLQQTLQSTALRPVATY
jgi:hypothetical protein